MDRVLFIDDDRFFGAPYVSKLREQLGPSMHVDICTKIDDAVHYFHKHLELRVIVLDVMMPPPQAEAYLTDDIAHSTEEGFATGVWYLRLLKQKLIDRQVHVFVLTNRNIDIVKVMVSALKFPPGLVECERKLAVPAEALPGRVSGLLNRPIE